MKPLFRFAGLAAVLASASAFACGGGWPSGPEGTLLLLVVLAVVVLVPVGLVAAAVTLLVLAVRGIGRAMENAEDERAKGAYVSGDWRAKPATK